MNQRRLDHFRKCLETMDRQLCGDIESIEESTHHASGGQNNGDISNVPFHLGDMGTDEFMHQMNSLLLVNELQLQIEVRAALTRIREKTYGICEACARPINSERLEVLPFATHCITCAKSMAVQPMANLNTGRPRAPEDTLAPEGEMGESRRPGQGAYTDHHAPFTDQNDQMTSPRRLSDTYAAGTPGGGDAAGGLAGSNVGHGDPQVADLEDAMGDGRFDADEDRERHHPSLQGD